MLQKLPRRLSWRLGAASLSGRTSAMCRARQGRIPLPKLPPSLLSQRRQLVLKPLDKIAARLARARRRLRQGALQQELLPLWATRALLSSQRWQSRQTSGAALQFLDAYQHTDNAATAAKEQPIPIQASWLERVTHHSWGMVPALGTEQTRLSMVRGLVVGQGPVFLSPDLHCAMQQK